MIIEITTQQAVELEMLLQFVRDFGIQVEEVETNLYSSEIASLHEQIIGLLNARVVPQKPLDEREKLSLSDARDRLWGRE